MLINWRVGRGDKNCNYTTDKQGWLRVLGSEVWQWTVKKKATLQETPAYQYFHSECPSVIKRLLVIKKSNILWHIKDHHIDYHISFCGFGDISLDAQEYFCIIFKCNFFKKKENSIKINTWLFFWTEEIQAFNPYCWEESLFSCNIFKLIWKIVTSINHIVVSQHNG